MALSLIQARYRHHIVEICMDRLITRASIEAALALLRKQGLSAVYRWQIADALRALPGGARGARANPTAISDALRAYGAKMATARKWSTEAPILSSATPSSPA